MCILYGRPWGISIKSKILANLGILIIAIGIVSAIVSLATFGSSFTAYMNDQLDSVLTLLRGGLQGLGLSIIAMVAGAIVSIYALYLGISETLVPVDKEAARPQLKRNPKVIEIKSLTLIIIGFVLMAIGGVVVFAGLSLFASETTGYDALHSSTHATEFVSGIEEMFLGVISIFVGLIASMWALAKSGAEVAGHIVEMKK